MKNFYTIIFVTSLLLSSSFTSARAGLLSNLLGLEDYESCITDELKKAKTSREIKKANDYCKRKHPNAGALSVSGSDNVSIPVVELPVVPLATLPLIPLVPVPTR